MVKTGPVAPPVSLLMAVRAARHENYDRVVFEFAGQLPGYRVQYTQPPIQQDASGLPIKIAGNAFLTVRMEPAAVHDDSGKPTMALKELVLNLPSLLELKQTGDFEAVVGWVLGLRQQVDFTVIELKEPTRLVIDVAHP